MIKCLLQKPIRLVLILFSIAWLGSSDLAAQGNRLTGQITDENGEPLIGATIIVVGTTIGSATDIDGNYTLDLPNNAESITISYIGYTTETLSINSRSVINVSLIPNLEQLAEIVVVGYGTQRRTDLTTAISTVKAEDISEIPAASVEQTLQGRAAGVTVVNGGSPGERTAVRIRGLSTFGNGDPLYVVDGVFTSSLTNINPSSIKKIDILKDAAAAAVYGSRGSNGVIIITTDRGIAGKTTFKLNAYTGVQNSNQRYDVLNTEQYVNYIREINAQGQVPNGGGTTIDVVNDDPTFNGNGVETDWQDELFRTAPITSYDFSAQGGSENGTFSVGASAFDQEGIYIDTEFKRYTLNFNSELNITDKFTVGQTFALGYSDRVAPQISDGREPLFNVLASAPYTLVRNPDGSFSGSTSEDANNSRNQIRVQDSDDNRSRNTSLIGSIYGQYEIIEGLTFRSQFGLDAFYFLNDRILRAYDEGGQFSKDDTNVTKVRSNQISRIFTNSLSYNKTFGGVHNFDLTLVSERQDITFETTTASSINDVTSQINELVATGAATSSSTEDEILISYLGRINYNYDGKYFFSGSIRRDKSSRFGPNNQVGIFPAASVGWALSKEPFLEGNPMITNLKLRASYGVTGNNTIARNSFNATLASIFNYPIGASQELGLGTAPNGFSNLDLKWEESTKTNVGVDLGLWNDKFTFSFEYFSNQSDDLLIATRAFNSAGVPGGSNRGGAVSRNAADVGVDGFEITFGYNDYEGDFKWSAWANISRSESVVNNTGPEDQILQAQFDPLQTTLSRLSSGDPFYHFFGFVFEGVYSTEQDIIDHLGADNVQRFDGASDAAYLARPGDVRYADLNGDGDITDEDRTIIGDPNPDFTFSANLRAEYKGFDASLLLNGVQGVDAFNGLVFNLESQENVLNRGVEVLRRWQQPGDITDIPRFRFGQNSNNNVSTRYIQDASYVRLKNLTVGYTLPESLLGKAFKGGLNKVRVYVQTLNLLTITDYEGLDPEIEPYYSGSGIIEGLGIDRGRGPQPRTFIGGIQIQF